MSERMDDSWLEYSRDWQLAGEESWQGKRLAVGRGRRWQLAVI